MTKIAKIAAATAALDAAIEVRYAALASFRASGTNQDHAALQDAIKAQNEASATLAKLGR